MIFRHLIRLLPVAVAACQWRNDDAQPKTASYMDGGTSFTLGGRTEPADTCIGRALRGRQASHAPFPLV